MTVKKCELCKKSFKSYAKTPRFCSRYCYARKPLSSLEEMFWKTIIKTDKCWEWSGAKGGSGYGRINVGRPQKILYAHRVSWVLHFGEIKNDLHVLHKCDNRACVNPNHLFLGTNLDNIKDMVAKGRNAKKPWINSKNLKLSYEIAEKIRSHGRVIKRRELMKMYRVSYSTIKAVQLNKAWVKDDTKTNNGALQR